MYHKTTKGGLFTEWAPSAKIINIRLRRYQMKSIVRQMWCMLLIASLLFQPASVVFGQACQNRGGTSAVYGELQEARRILGEDSGAKGSQDAVAPLERAKRAANDAAFAKAYSGKVSAFQNDIEKARLKVLWNDRSEALAIVCRLLGLLDSAAKQPVPQNPCGNGPGAGLALGATLIAGIGAVFVGIFFGLGQVSHR